MYGNKLSELTVKQLQQLKTTFEGHVTDEILGMEATKFVELQEQTMQSLKQGDLRDVCHLLPKLVQSQEMIKMQLLN
jgi:hypothetical protein